MASNPVTTCIGCTQSDNHPKHLLVEGSADIRWHYDCHSIATGCGICSGVVDNANGARGDKLRAHLMKGGK